MNILYRYECSRCGESFPAADWNLATAKRLKKWTPHRPLLQILDGMTKIEEAFWDGESWFICPHCDSEQWDEPGSITFYRYTPKTNADAMTLLEKE